jgi:hypothetical protein
MRPLAAAAVKHDVQEVCPCAGCRGQAGAAAQPLELLCPGTCRPDRVRDVSAGRRSPHSPHHLLNTIHLTGVSQPAKCPAAWAPLLWLGQRKAGAAHACVRSVRVCYTTAGLACARARSPLRHPPSPPDSDLASAPPSARQLQQLDPEPERCPRQHPHPVRRLGRWRHHWHHGCRCVCRARVIVATGLQKGLGRQRLGWLRPHRALHLDLEPHLPQRTYYVRVVAALIPHRPHDDSTAPSLPLLNSSPAPLHTCIPPTTAESTGFDPIFFLHHTNVDFIFALYRAWKPNVTVTPGQNTEGEFLVRPSKAPEAVSINSDLPPWCVRGARREYDAVAGGSLDCWLYVCSARPSMALGRQSLQRQQSAALAFAQLHAPAPLGFLSSWSAQRCVPSSAGIITICT